MDTLTAAQRTALAALLAAATAATDNRTPYRDAADLTEVAGTPISGAALAALVRKGYARTASRSGAMVAAYRPAPAYRITAAGCRVAARTAGGAR